MKKLRLCRLLCGKAPPFRPSRQKEKNNKVFRLGSFPESRRLSAQQAAKPRQTIASGRTRFFHTFVAWALLGRSVEAEGKSPGRLRSKGILKLFSFVL